MAILTGLGSGYSIPNAQPDPKPDPTFSFIISTLYLYIYLWDRVGSGLIISP